VKDFIRTNLDCGLRVKDLASLVDLSPRQFFRRFLNTFGTTPHRYVVNERVTQAKQLLLSKQQLGAIAVTVGFANQGHFSVVFRKATGISPNRFRLESFGQDCSGDLEALSHTEQGRAAGESQSYGSGL
jgi:AraC family transcriptional regulator